MQNVLVTGGAGFIGSNFVRFLLGRDPLVKIINLDALTYAGNIRNLSGIPSSDRHTFIQGDICDHRLVEELLRQHRIDTVVHFAAESHVDRSIAGPAKCVQTNVVGTFTLLEAARQVWMVEDHAPVDRVRFHHVSTDEVYGTLDPEAPPFTEMAAYAPRSPYAATKAASDHLVRSYFTTYGLPVTIDNCSNNYGPYQFPEKLIPLVILNAIHGDPLPIYGDGQQVRDWVHVKDHCEAILAILRHGRVGETYNVGEKSPHTNLEAVTSICRFMDELHPQARPHEELIQFVPDRPGHDRRYEIDIQKIQAELGWSPHISFSTGLRGTVEWYLNHMDWMDAISHDPDYLKWIQHNYVERGN